MARIEPRERETKAVGLARWQIVKLAGKKWNIGIRSNGFPVARVEIIGMAFRLVSAELFREAPDDASRREVIDHLRREVRRVFGVDA